MWNDLLRFLKPGAAVTQVPTLRKTVFLHVMKTGGTSFQGVLKSIYGDAFHLVDDSAIASIEAARAQYDCLELHIKPQDSGWSCLHSEIIRQQRWDLLDGCDVFTMLRDPVEQVISEHFYLRRIRDQVEPILHTAGHVFADSLLERLASPVTFNTQVAFLAGKTQTEGDCVTAEDLEAVKEMLRRWRVHVGLTERFSDSMNVFETVTGKQIPGGVIGRENRSSARRSRQTLSSRVRARIEENSALDRELWEFGRELLNEDLARCPPTRQYVFAGPGPLAEPTPPAAKKTVFLHVMRAGGRSMRGVLASVYGDRLQICDEPDLNAVEADLAAFDCCVFHSVVERGEFLHSHGEVMQQRRWDLFAGADVLTLFRDPVERVASDYFALTQHRARLEPIYRSKGLNFPETLEAFAAQPVYRDQQLSFFLGRFQLQGAVPVARTDLKDAQQILLQLNIHPGLTEKFDGFLNIFEEVTGRRIPKRPIYRIKQNHSRPAFESVPMRIRDRIRKENQLDSELYDFAQELFFADLARCGTTREYSFV